MKSLDIGFLLEQGPTYTISLDHEPVPYSRGWANLHLLFPIPSITHIISWIIPHPVLSVEKLSSMNLVPGAKKVWTTIILLLLLSHFSRVWVAYNTKTLIIQAYFNLVWAIRTPNQDVCVLVAQLCPILCNPMDCSPPGSSGHGILQAEILEWVAIAFST